MVMCAAISFAGSWPRAPQLFPTPSWFMPNLGRGVSALWGAEGPAQLLPSSFSCVPQPHVCPISWAMVNAVARPMSSLILQLLSRSHIPPTGARPGKQACRWGFAARPHAPCQVSPQGQGHPHRCLEPAGLQYLVCHRVCSYRCRCHSCGERGQRGEGAGLPPLADATLPNPSGG
jgi:hypothetical protein